MAQGQQAVVGVLAVQRIVGPMTVEPPLVGPKRVDEVQALLLERGE